MTYGHKSHFDPVTIEVEVVNEHGLHARPAHKVVVLANHYTSTIRVIKDELEVDAKSIMSLMMLAAEKGTMLTIRAEGPDGKEAADALCELFASGFGE